MYNFGSIVHRCLALMQSTAYCIINLKQQMVLFDMLSFQHQKSSISACQKGLNSRTFDSSYNNANVSCRNGYFFSSLCVCCTTLKQGDVIQIHFLADSFSQILRVLFQYTLYSSEHGLLDFDLNIIEVSTKYWPGTCRCQAKRPSLPQKHNRKKVMCSTIL